MCQFPKGEDWNLLMKSEVFELTRFLVILPYIMVGLWHVIFYCTLSKPEKIFAFQNECFCLKWIRPSK